MASLIKAADYKIKTHMQFFVSSRMDGLLLDPPDKSHKGSPYKNLPVHLTNNKRQRFLQSPTAYLLFDLGDLRVKVTRCISSPNSLNPNSGLVMRLSVELV